ncbi:MAG TPA: RNA polymerase sigma factor [Tepidisphaeraceae bacterium]|jgi:RNA polymerase sigma-70 factor (ECF subfamily)
MDERRLIGRLRAGDEQACAQLVRIHHAPIYRMLAALVRDVHLAEDLCQETFTAAWKSLKHFDERSSLKTWLHAIAYRKFLDARRRGRGRSEGTLVDLPQRQDPLVHLVMDEQQRALYEAIDQLKDRDREVIVLRYLQQMSYAEICAVLGEPGGTVRWRVKEALTKLKQLLTPYANEETQPDSRSARAACRSDP